MLGGGAGAGATGGGAGRGRLAFTEYREDTAYRLGFVWQGRRLPAAATTA